MRHFFYVQRRIVFWFLTILFVVQPAVVYSMRAKVLREVVRLGVSAAYAQRERMLDELRNKKKEKPTPVLAMTEALSSTTLYVTASVLHTATGVDYRPRKTSDEVWFAHGHLYSNETPQPTLSDQAAMEAAHRVNPNIAHEIQDIERENGFFDYAHAAFGWFFGDKPRSQQDGYDETYVAPNLAKRLNISREEALNVVQAYRQQQAAPQKTEPWDPSFSSGGEQVFGFSNEAPKKINHDTACLPVQAVHSLGHEQNNPQSEQGVIVVTPEPDVVEQTLYVPINASPEPLVQEKEAFVKALQAKHPREIEQEALWGFKVTLGGTLENAASEPPIAQQTSPRSHISQGVVWSYTVTLGQSAAVEPNIPQPAQASLQSNVLQEVLEQSSNAVPSEPPIAQQTSPRSHMSQGVVWSHTTILGKTSDAAANEPPVTQSVQVPESEIPTSNVPVETVLNNVESVASAAGVLAVSAAKVASAGSVAAGTTTAGTTAATQVATINMAKLGSHLVAPHMAELNALLAAQTGMATKAVATTQASTSFWGGVTAVGAAKVVLAGAAVAATTYVGIELFDYAWGAHSGYSLYEARRALDYRKLLNACDVLSLPGGYPCMHQADALYKAINALPADQRIQELAKHIKAFNPTQSLQASLNAIKDWIIQNPNKLAEAELLRELVQEIVENAQAMPSIKSEDQKKTQATGCGQPIAKTQSTGCGDTTPQKQEPLVYTPHQQEPLTNGGCGQPPEKLPTKHVTPALDQPTIDDLVQKKNNESTKQDEPQNGRYDGPKYGNMNEVFEKEVHGKKLKDSSERVKGHRYKGAQVYRATKNIPEYGIKEGEAFYLDTLHGDHIEVFKKARFKQPLTNVVSVNGDHLPKKYSQAKGRKYGIK